MSRSPFFLLKKTSNQIAPNISCPLSKEATSAEVLRHWIYMVERITQVGDDNGKDEFQSERGNSRRKEKENIGRCESSFERGHKEKKRRGLDDALFFPVPFSHVSLSSLSLSLSLTNALLLLSFLTAPSDPSLETTTTTVQTSPRPRR